MRFELVVQDPTRSAPASVIDAVGKAALRANFGRAFFSFATVAGVELLLQHDNIAALIRRGTFELVLGIDAITNRATLEKVQAVAKARPGLKPLVFWHSEVGIFHPKLCYFLSGSHLTLVTGSANLTPRGLRDNCEAVSIIECKRADGVHLRSVIDEFFNAHAQNIRPIDEEALRRAARNNANRPIAELEPPAQTSHRPSRGANDLLIAELPRGGNRWQQANFDTGTAREYFGVDPARQSNFDILFLSEIDGAGATVSEELRKFTFTRSRNLRIQLGAKRGSEYPRSRRPIAVFRRVGGRHFLYQLLLPGERHFRAVSNKLNAISLDGVRRILTSSSGIATWWPRSPFLP